MQFAVNKHKTRAPDGYCTHHDSAIAHEQTNSLRYKKGRAGTPARPFAKRIKSLLRRHLLSFGACGLTNVDFTTRGQTSFVCQGVHRRLN
jgi:hypothetical protein